MWIVVLTFVLLTGSVGLVTWFFVRNDKNETADKFFMAGRDLPWAVVSGSLLLTNLSAVHLVSMNGTAYSEGIVVAGWETLAACACALMAVYFLPRYLRLKVATSPEFLEKRFDSVTRTIVCCFFLLDYTVEELPGAMYSGAIAFNQIFRIQESLGWEGDAGKFWTLTIIVWMTGIIGGVYSIVGGLRAVAISDTMNGVGMFLAGISVPILGLRYIGNGDVVEGMSILYSKNREKFDMAGGPETSIPWQTNFTGMIVVQIYYWCMSQAMIQRVLAARNVRHAQKGVVVTGLFKVLVPLIVVLPGIIAYHILTEDGVQLYKPEVCKKSGITPCPIADEAYPRMLEKLVPHWALGIYAAVLAGAVLSTFNSNLNSVATMMTFDVYKVWINPVASEERTVKIGRNVSIFVGVMSMLIAPFFMFTPSAYVFLNSINGLWNCQVFCLISIGMLDITIFGIRINGDHIRPRAAWYCCFICPALFAILRWGLPAINPALEIHFLHVTGIVTALGIAYMFLHGWIWPMDSGEIYVMQKRILKPTDRDDEGFELDPLTPFNAEDILIRASQHKPSMRNSSLQPTVIDEYLYAKASASGKETAGGMYQKPWSLVHVGSGFITIFALSLYALFHAV
jgi:SSS family solute:Na+ symporter